MAIPFSQEDKRAEMHSSYCCEAGKLIKFDHHSQMFFILSEGAFSIRSLIALEQSGRFHSGKYEHLTKHISC